MELVQWATQGMELEQVPLEVEHALQWLGLDKVLGDTCQELGILEGQHLDKEHLVPHMELVQ